VIRYNGLPMTPEADMAIALEGKHAMVSMADDRQIDTAVEICQSVVGDSGAFTYWKNGGVLDVDEYVRWSRWWLRHPAFSWVVVPDVIDGTEKENDELLAAWPFPKHQSVPVFHLHESLERLRRLASSDFPLIALGSSGQYANPGSRTWWDRIAHLMEILCDSDGFPVQPFHGLRMLDSTLFSHIPFRSVDSCNVARNIGIDGAWNGPYAPSRRWVRALIMINRNERHAAARRWCRQSAGVQQNMELLG
jgi:hypothetical protein